MDTARPAHPDAEGLARERALLTEIRARLAQVRAEGAEELVVGLWEPGGGLLVAALAGEMDMGNATELEPSLATALRRAPTRLILELSELTFIDSSGIKELVLLERSLTRAGATMQVVAPRAHIARVFELAKLDELLKLEPSLEAALGLRAEPRSPAPAGSEAAR